MTAAWEVVDARKRYDSTVALDGSTFACRPGQVSALIGHNGAGKSTLFKCAVGLAVLDGGTMTALGTDVRLPRARSGVALMPEQPDLYPGVSVWEHVAFICHLHGVRQWRGRAADLLEQFGLASARDRLPHELSQGMRRRLSLVMSLLHGARLLLLDEPFNGLDPQANVELRQAIRALADDGVAVVLSTHILPDVERYASQVILLAQGRVVYSGSVAEVITAAGNGVNLEDAYLALTGDR